jgi:hypothetical protein
VAVKVTCAAEGRGDGRGEWWREEVRAAVIEKNPRFTLNLWCFKFYRRLTLEVAGEALDL